MWECLSVSIVKSLELLKKNENHPIFSKDSLLFSMASNLRLLAEEGSEGEIVSGQKAYAGC